MKTKNKILSIVASFILVGSSVAVVKPTYAFSGGLFGSGSYFTKLVDFISQKFGLDKTQVQTAVNDFHAQQKATLTPRPTPSADDIKAQEKRRLDPFVTQGKITADQETAIIAELGAVRAKYPAVSGETPDQRKTRMTNIQTDLTAWAKANNVDSKYVLPMAGGRGMMGGERGKMGEGRERGIRGNWKPSPTPSI